MKSCVIIYNPNSGKETKHDFVDDFRKILIDYDYIPEFYKTEYRGHAREIVKTLKKVDLVISIGGDGTFSEVMSGNFDRTKRLLLAHIPTGTANDIGAMYGYGRNMCRNLKLLLEGTIKKIDICTINNQPFVYVAGLGKFVHISYDTPRRLKKKYGYFAYLIEGVKEVRERISTSKVKYEVNGEVFEERLSFILISNANRIAGINNFYKDVKLNDNQFEVLVSTLNNKKDLLKSLYYLTKTDITNLPGFKFYKTNNLKIEFEKPLKKGWSIDGEEYLGNKVSFEIKMINNVEILLPNKNIKKLFIEEG